MTTLPYADDWRRPVVPREGAPAVTLTSCYAETPFESYSLRTVPVWMKANGRKVKINAILDDASNETFLNEEVAGVLGLQEPFQKVQVHVLNDTVETFQSMPLKIEIESVDGRFSKEISIKTCPQKVTGNYRVVNWSEYQNKWPHLTQCSFAKPANDEFVDLLTGIDNSELHYSHVDLRGKNGGPIARLGPLGTIPRYPFLVHTGASMERKKRILLRRRQQPKEILGNRKIRHGPRRQTCTHRRRETGFK